MNGVFTYRENQVFLGKLNPTEQKLWFLKYTDTLLTRVRFKIIEWTLYIVYNMVIIRTGWKNFQWDLPRAKALLTRVYYSKLQCRMGFNQLYGTPIACASLRHFPQGKISNGPYRSLHVINDPSGVLYTNNLIRSGKPTHLTHTAKAGWVAAFSQVFASQ